MYLRTTQRRNKDGSVVRYYALAENVRHPGKGYVEARVVHSFGRADRLDRAALERLVASIRRILEEAGGEAGARAGSSVGGIAIEASFELGRERDDPDVGSAALDFDQNLRGIERLAIAS